MFFNFVYVYNPSYRTSDSDGLATGRSHFSFGQFVYIHVTRGDIPEQWFPSFFGHRTLKPLGFCGTPTPPYIFIEKL